MVNYATASKGDYQLICKKMEQRAPVVLIVDDEANLREIFGIVLQGVGYTVQEASDGLVALNYLETTGAPQLLLTDIKMPNMLGTQLLEKLVEKNYNVPSIIISGGGVSVDDYERAKGYVKQMYKQADREFLEGKLNSIGIRDFDDLITLEKPFKLDRLRDRATLIMSLYDRTP